MPYFSKVRNLPFALHDCLDLALLCFGLGSFPFLNQYWHLGEARDYDLMSSPFPNPFRVMNLELDLTRQNCDQYNLIALCQLSCHVGQLQSDHINSGLVNMVLPDPTVIYRCYLSTEHERTYLRYVSQSEVQLLRSLIECIEIWERMWVFTTTCWARL